MVDATIHSFRRYKLDRIRAHLQYARMQRERGRHAQAVWYQHLAALARKTLTLDTDYLTAMRSLMAKN